MTTPVSRRSPVARSTDPKLPPEVRALLIDLSRRNTHLIVERDSNRFPVVIVLECRGRAARSIGTADWSTFMATRDAGLIACDAARARWHLTDIGTTVARRIRAIDRARQTARARHLHAIPHRSAMSAPAFNDMESPIAWLHRRLDKNGQPLVDDKQYQAGERLRADLYFAQLTPRITGPWSGVPSAPGPRATPGSGMDMSDRLVAAKQRVNAALHAVGPELGGILIDVCGHLQGLEAIERREKWPARSAKLVLQKALNALARHYGLLPSAAPDAVIAHRLRHWGTEDFRPTIRAVERPID